MKASELIYRLARAIEENGDCDVKVAVEGVCGEDDLGVIDKTFEADVKWLDINYGDSGKYFEIYGEE